MGQQIIEQPDGRYAVFDTVTDTLIVIDATAAEVIEWRAEEAADQARERARRDIERVRAGKSPLTLTWGEALERNGANGGPLTPEREPPEQQP